MGPAQEGLGRQEEKLGDKTCLGSAFLQCKPVCWAQRQREKGGQPRTGVEFKGSTSYNLEIVTPWMLSDLCPFLSAGFTLANFSYWHFI